MGPALTGTRGVPLPRLALSLHARRSLTGTGMVHHHAASRAPRVGGRAHVYVRSPYDWMDSSWPHSARRSAGARSQRAWS